MLAPFLDEKCVEKRDLLKWDLLLLKFAAWGCGRLC